MQNIDSINNASNNDFSGRVEILHEKFMRRNMLNPFLLNRKKNPDIFSGGLNQIILRPFALISNAAEDRTILQLISHNCLASLS